MLGAMINWNRYVLFINFSEFSCQLSQKVITENTKWQTTSIVILNILQKMSKFQQYKGKDKSLQIFVDLISKNNNYIKDIEGTTKS